MPYFSSFFLKPSLSCLNTDNKIVYYQLRFLIAWTAKISMQKSVLNGQINRLNSLLLIGQKTVTFTFVDKNNDFSFLKTYVLKIFTNRVYETKNILKSKIKLSQGLVNIALGTVWDIRAPLVKAHFDLRCRTRDSFKIWLLLSKLGHIRVLWL